MLVSRRSTRARRSKTVDLVYVDSAAVSPVKTGCVLIIEGIENAERGFMLVCIPQFLPSPP